MASPAAVSRFRPTYRALSDDEKAALSDGHAKWAREPPGRDPAGVCGGAVRGQEHVRFAETIGVPAQGHANPGLVRPRFNLRVAGCSDRPKDRWKAPSGGFFASPLHRVGQSEYTSSQVLSDDHSS